MNERGLWRKLARWTQRAALVERDPRNAAERLAEHDARMWRAAVTRRGFLQAAGAGALVAGLSVGAGGGLTACRGDERPTDKGLDDRHPDVAILGAGLAGLTCLHSLVQRGLRPVVYEQSE